MTVTTLIRFASIEEKKKIERLARISRLSLANYVRMRLDLEPLAHGGPRPNAVKKKPDRKPKEEKPE
ncbi:MAG: hypothetical protein J2P41_10985 [Blastocatellia bacterium]|nr:hypothetical protein [Blastocatellia bacterium]